MDKFIPAPQELKRVYTREEVVRNLIDNKKAVEELIRAREDRLRDIARRLHPYDIINNAEYYEAYEKTIMECRTAIYNLRERQFRLSEAVRIVGGGR